VDMKKNQLDKAQVKRAVRALMTHHQKTTAEKAKEMSTKALLEEDDTFSLVISWKKMKEQKNVGKHGVGPLLKPIVIPLPHTLHANAEICVFTKDPQKEWKEKFLKAAVSNVEKVVGLTKLRKNYKTFEAKRRLCTSYHLFMADDSILPMLSKLLGKEFFSRKKIPIGINLKKKNIGDVIARARDATYLTLTGACSSVKVGLTSFTEDQVVANIFAVASCLGKKWKNVQSINIKTTESIALPIYNSLPELRDPVAVEEKKARKAAEKAEKEKQEKLELERLIAESDMIDSEFEWEEFSDEDEGAKPKSSKGKRTKTKAKAEEKKENENEEGEEEEEEKQERGEEEEKEDDESKLDEQENGIEQAEEDSGVVTKSKQDQNKKKNLSNETKKTHHQQQQQQQKKKAKASAPSKAAQKTNGAQQSAKAGTPARAPSSPAPGSKSPKAAAQSPSTPTKGRKNKNSSSGPNADQDTPSKKRKLSPAETAAASVSTPSPSKNNKKKTTPAAKSPSSAATQTSPQKTSATKKSPQKSQSPATQKSPATRKSPAAVQKQGKSPKKRIHV